MTHSSRPSLRRPRVQAMVPLLVAGFLVATGPITAATPDAAPPSVPSASAPIQIQLQPFARGLAYPVFVTGDGSGTGGLYAVEQLGRLRAISSDGAVDPVPFLDISDRVVFRDEQGLLGLALHPGYAENGRFFVDYTRAHDGATVISEFTAVDGKGDPGSERILLTISQPFENHNGGMIAFDSTGMLLIGMGDGGNGGDPFGNGQNRKSLLGKILRIDVDGATPYGIPSDAPFIDASDTEPEIQALGLRNPWRFSVDRLTGDVFIGDVGQESWEEIDVLPTGTGGQDLGWNIIEGQTCYLTAGCDRTGLTDPVYIYPHGAECTVIGGYVYRGERWPGLAGTYLFGDYCSGKIWALPAAEAVAEGTARATLVGSLVGSLVSFGQGDDGELYVVDLDGGRIERVVI